MFGLTIFQKSEIRHTSDSLVVNVVSCCVPPYLLTMAGWSKEVPTCQVYVCVCLDMFGKFCLFVCSLIYIYIYIPKVSKKMLREGVCSTTN